MLIKKIKRILLLAFLLIFLFFSIILLLNDLIHRPAVQEYLVKRLSDSIGIDISTHEIDLNLWGGLGLMINGLDAGSKDGKQHIMASKVRILLSARDLIDLEIVPKSIQIIQPKTVLTLKERYGTPLGQIGTGVIGLFRFRTTKIQSISIVDGQVILTGRNYYLSDLYITINQTSAMPLTVNMNANGKFGFRGSEVQFKVSGIILPGLDGESPTSLDVNLETGKAPLAWFNVPGKMYFKNGEYITNMKIEGDPKNNLSVYGMVEAFPSRFSLIKGARKKDYSIPGLKADFSSEIKEKIIRFHSLKFSNKDLNFSVDLSLDFVNLKNPNLEFKASGIRMPVELFKTIFPSHLVTPWIETELFPILQSGSVSLESLHMKGSIEQLRHLRIKENQSALELDLACQDLKISEGNGNTMPFDGVSADISFKDGILYIKDVSGNFGNSEIRKSSVEIRDIYSGIPLYKNRIGGAFDIQDLVRQKEMRLVTDRIREQVDKYKDLTGRIDCRIDFDYTSALGFPEIRSGRFLARDCLIDRVELRLPINIKEAFIQIGEIGQDRFMGMGTWGNSRFSASGEFVIENNRAGLQSVDISSESDMNQIIPVLLDRDVSLSFNKDLSWNASIKREGDQWTSKGEIDLGDMVLETENLGIDTKGHGTNILFDLVIQPGDGINFKRVYFTSNNSSMELSGAYDFRTTDFAGIEIASEGFLIKDLGVYSKKKELIVDGKLWGDVTLNSLSSDLKIAGISGRAHGEDLYFHSDRFSAPVDDCSFQLDFEDNNLSVEKLKMMIGDSDFNVKGRLEEWKNPKGEISITSTYLDISDIYRISEKPEDEGGKSLSNLLKNANMNARLNVEKGLWRKLSYGPLKAELLLKDGNVYVEDSDIELENGSMELYGRLSIRDSVKNIIFGKVAFKDQPIDELMRAIEIENDSIKSSLTMEAKLSIEGNSKEEYLSSLNGTASISLREGLIKKSRVFIKVLDFFSLQNIFKKRPPDLRDEGLYFESMTGDAKIKNGILRCENFRMRSPVFNAVAYGEIDLPKWKADFVLGTQPHGIIDSLVGKIPILGYIITGEKKSILAYSFSVKGSISKPEVEFIPMELLGESVGGVLKRLLLTPKKVIDDIEGYSRELIPGN